MTDACMLPSDGCWALDPLPAGTALAVALIFIVVTSMVAAASLPGYTRLLLGRSEKVAISSRVFASLAYVAWLICNALLALVLWRALFPFQRPVSIVAYAPGVTATPRCGGRLDTRCLQGELTVQAGTNAAILPVEWAQRLLGQSLSVARDIEPKQQLSLTDDVVAFGVLQRVPVKKIVLVTSGPLSAEELPKSFPWIARYLDRTRRVYVRKESPVAVKNVEDCLSSLDKSDPDVAEIRICSLGRDASGRIEKATAYIDGDSVVLEVEGASLPNRIYLRLGEFKASKELPTDANAGSRTFARLELGKKGDWAKEDVRLEIGHADGVYTHSIPVTNPPPVCLLLQGKTVSEASAWRDSLLAKAPIDESVGAVLRRLRGVDDRCDGTVIFVASNGTVVVARDLTRDGLEALAQTLEPGAAKIAFPVRILDPRFDVAPGLLDDVHFANVALDVSHVVANPLVVREVPFNTTGISGKGYSDFEVRSIASSIDGLAPIVAWVEGVKGAASRPVLAASFGQFLDPAADQSQRRASWSTVVVMLGVYRGSSTARSPQVDRSDAIGVALEAASDSRRQRMAFLALSGWMLLAFLLRRLT